MNESTTDREAAHPSGATGTASPRDRRWWTLTLLLALVVAGFALWQDFGAVRSSTFHPDESRWINRAPYIRELGDPLGDFWAERYLIKGQPPFGSYVTGVGLLLQGRDLDTNGPWDFNFGTDTIINWNTAAGRMPADADLVAGRRTQSVLAVVTAVALFALVTLFTNRAGGLVAGLFFAYHPLTIYLATISTSDALFSCLVALTACAAAWLARNPTWWRALLVSMLLAAGAATKLSPLLLTVPLAAFGVALVLDPVLRRIPLAGTLWGAVSRGEPGSSQRLGVMLAIQPPIVFGLFVLAYPYLWSAPIGRTQALFTFRRSEMASQARIWPRAAIHNPIEAVERVWVRLSEYQSVTGKIEEQLGALMGRTVDGYGFELPFAVAGLVILVVICWRRGLGSPTTLGALLLVGQGALIVAGLGVDFDRYYLPVVLVVATGIGVLAGTLWARFIPIRASQPTTREPAVAAT